MGWSGTSARTGSDRTGLVGNVGEAGIGLNGSGWSAETAWSDQGWYVSWARAGSGGEGLDWPVGKGRAGMAGRRRGLGRWDTAWVVGQGRVDAGLGGAVSWAGTSVRTGPAGVGLAWDGLSHGAGRSGRAWLVGLARTGKSWPGMAGRRGRDGNGLGSQRGRARDGTTGVVGQCRFEAARNGLHSHPDVASCKSITLTPSF